MDENKVVADNSNTAEPVVAETTEEVASPETTNEETIEDVRAKLAKAEEIANNQRIRAEKLESEKKNKKPEEKKTTGDLSSKDIIALMNAKVAEEDIDEVTDYAKFKGISVTDALKTGTIKATLAERSEQRNTASATNTGPARRGSSVVSDEALLSNAQTGKVPESEGDIARLIAAKVKAGRR